MYRDSCFIGPFSIVNPNSTNNSMFLAKYGEYTPSPLNLIESKTRLGSLKAFPNPLVKVAEGVGNYIKGGGILGILPNLMSNVNEKVGGIFNQDKAPSDMGTRMSSMDQADLDALKGPSMADISGPGTAATGFDNEADAICRGSASEGCWCGSSPTVEGGGCWCGSRQRFA